MVSEWIAGCIMPAAWLSLDEGDGEPVRILSYVIAALQTIQAGIGEGLLTMLDSNPPQVEAILTTLLNEVSAILEHVLLILDDYHLIDSQTVDQALAFLVEHCRHRCTWSSPPVKIHSYPFPGYAPGTS